MCTHPFNPIFSCYWMKSLLKYFLNTRDIFIFQNRLLQIDILFVALIDKKTVNLEKLIEYWVSAVDVRSPNPCLGPILRINLSFSLLSVCTDKLISTPKIVAFSPSRRRSSRFFSSRRRSSRFFSWKTFRFPW